MAVKHTKVSAIPDGPDTDLIRPSDWNASHSIENDTVTEAMLAFDPNAYTDSQVTKAVIDLLGIDAATLEGQTAAQIQSAVTAAIVDASPATLDTLNELAAALGDDPNFATTITNLIATETTAREALEVVVDGKQALSEWGTLAARPTASDAQNTYYWATDDDGGKLYQSQETSTDVWQWIQIAVGLSEQVPHADRHATGGGDEVTPEDIGAARETGRYGGPSTDYVGASGAFQSVGFANRTVYHLAIGRGSINGVKLSVGTQSGNICVSIHAADGTRKTTTGSIACPAGVTDVALGSTVEIEEGDYFALGCDNTTATFRAVGSAAVGDTMYEDIAGWENVFPAPNPATFASWGLVRGFAMRGVTI